MKLKFVAPLCLLVALASCASAAEQKVDIAAEKAQAEIKMIADVPHVPEIPEKDALIYSMISEMTLAEKVGQMFICSFETNVNGLLTEMDENTAETIKKYNIGGVIYFASNIDDAEQTKALSDDFQRVSKIPLFIAIDEEGGRVSRITRSQKIEFQKTPPAKEIGNTKDSENAYNAAVYIASKLLELGINVNFAPCADLNTDNKGVIGDRAFSGDPHIAGEFVKESVKGYEESKIISAVKHYPGHGIAPGDTHEEEIISEKSLSDILKEDIIPFAAGIEAGAPMVMLSHITVSEWGAPASLSENAVSYLRDEMGYDGILITDSLRMGAIANYYTSEQAAVSAVNAGINILLMPVSIEQAVEGVIASVMNGETNEDRIDQSVFRILSLKYDYGLLSATDAAD